MDEKDKKILAELIVNSRIAIASLAKKAGVSREVANYRIQRLIKEGIILNFYTIIDYGVLGFERYTFFLQLKEISPEKEREFFEYLKKHEYVTYAGPTVGKWNIVFDILSKDRVHLQNIIKGIIHQVEDNVDNYLVIRCSSDMESFPTKIFGENKEIKLNRGSKKIKLDEQDKKILKFLASNSRIEYKELSGKLRLSANAIKYRIKNLNKAGIIKGYTLAIDVSKLDYEWYNLQVKVVSQSTKNIESLKEFLRRSKKCIYFYYFLGNENWDLDIGLVIKNSRELRDFILELRNTGTQIKINDIYAVPEMIKPDIVPEGVLSNYDLT